MNDPRPRSRKPMIERCLAILGMCVAGLGAALAAPPPDPGRLFFTPAERARLEAIRARAPEARGPGAPASPDTAPPPLRYDGIVVRSDGRTTRWIDGKAARDGAAVAGLKPGQLRAEGRIYEPYQVVRPTPPAPLPPAKEPAP